ncbi:MAG: hypothetical protein Q7S75_00250 [bacterium]|nr:hypothetical protein [bacterium]
MPEFSKEKLKPSGLDLRGMPIERIKNTLNPERIKELFPQGSRTLYGAVVRPQIEELMKTAGVNMRSEEERDVLLGAIVNLIPEGEGARELRTMISGWRPPQ